MGISPELLTDISMDEYKAAMAAIDAMTEHFKGRNAGVSRETSEIRERIVSEYDLQKVFQLMAQSTETDWHQRPAFYGAVAMRILEELEPLEPKEDEDPGQAAPFSVVPDEEA